MVQNKFLSNNKQVVIEVTSLFLQGGHSIQLKMNTTFSHIDFKAVIVDHILCLQDVTFIFR